MRSVPSRCHGRYLVWVPWWRGWRMSGRYASAAERAINFSWLRRCTSCAVECAPVVRRVFPLSVSWAFHIPCWGYAFVWLHQKNTQVWFALRVPFFMAALIGCRALARGRKRLGDTMGIAVGFVRVAVHRYHPFRLVGAVLALCTSSIAEAWRFVKWVLVSLCKEIKL